MTCTTLGKEYGVTEGMLASRLVEALFEETLRTKPNTESTGETKTDDPCQTEAAQHIGSPALVNAGPGTGKTATLITRIKYLIGNSERIRPNCSYSHSAMRRRKSCVHGSKRSSPSSARKD